MQLINLIALYIGQIIASVVILLVFWVIASAIRKTIERVGKFKKVNIDIIELLAQGSYLAILTFGILTALGTLGIDTRALIAGLGLTGFALGLALQDSIGNLIAGVMILLYHPFERTDVIEVEGHRGEVKNITLRYTELVSSDRTTMIPNSIVFTKIVVVHRENQVRSG